MKSDRDYCRFPHCSDEFCKIDVSSLLFNIVCMRLSNFFILSERLRFLMAEFGDSRVSLSHSCCNDERNFNDQFKSPTS